MSNGLNRLSEEEKTKRRAILADLAQWKEATGSNSVAQYAREKGLPYPYVNIVAKWEQSLGRKSRSKIHNTSQSFMKVTKPLSSTAVNAHAPGAVKIVVAGVSIEVSEHSSRAALAVALSVLGVNNVPGL